MEFTKILQTSKKTSWVNTCQFIILHHTAWWTFDSNCTLLSTWSAQASCHYIVWYNWEVGKIWNDTDILWHAGQSNWWTLEDMNNYSIWIEVVWPDQNWWFSQTQMNKVNELVVFLAREHNIPKQNILRHKDIAPGRKTDIADTFWNTNFSSYSEYINNLFNNLVNMSKYTNILNNAIANWYVPLFDTHEWNQPLTEKETKELIDIAFSRFLDRVNAKK